jgi:hypothetical protein
MLPRLFDHLGISKLICLFPTTSATADACVLLPWLTCAGDEGDGDNNGYGGNGGYGYRDEEEEEEDGGWNVSRYY